MGFFQNKKKIHVDKEEDSLLNVIHGKQEEEQEEEIEQEEETRTITVSIRSSCGCGNGYSEGEMTVPEYTSYQDGDVVSENTFNHFQ